MQLKLIFMGHGVVLLVLVSYAQAFHFISFASAAESRGFLN